MIGGDHLDRPIEDTSDERLTVLAAPQRRIHLEATLLAQVVVCKQQVVRSRLAAHVKAPGLGLTNQFDAFAGRDVADMVLASGPGGQFDVALDLPPFALGRDSLMSVLAAVDAVVDVPAVQQVVHLAVGDDRLADSCRPAHGLLHQFGRLHAAPVIGETHHLGGQGRKIDQLPAAALPHGDRPVGHHMHRGIATDELRLPGQMLRGVGRRVHVRHRADGRIAATGSRSRSRGDGLLVRESRLAQVDVHVHESRHEPEAPEPDDAVVGTFAVGRDDPALLDGERSRLEAAVAENPGVGVDGSHALRRKKIGQLKQLP